MDGITKGARIRVGDRWEVRAYDSLNWQTWELKDGGKWRATGNYFQRVGHALEWIADRELKRGGDMDLAEAVERMERIAAELKAAA